MKRYYLVLGLGISGKAAVSFLLQQGHHVIGIDRKENPIGELDHFLFYPDAQEAWDFSWENIRPLSKFHSVVKTAIFGTFFAKFFNHMYTYAFEIYQKICTKIAYFRKRSKLQKKSIIQVIVSPGILPHHPLLLQAKAHGVEVIGEVEFACRYLQNPMVGVTGSNGKTTTTLLITHVLQYAGKKTKALGNVGVGLSSYLLDPDPEEILILELSSFQLQMLSQKCLDFAVILNISPNHLDWHSSMQEYATAKLSIRDRVKEGGCCFISRQVQDDFSSPGVLFEKTGLSQNWQAAFAICHRFGITEEKFHEAAATFCPPPHRMEYLGEIDGIMYYNDSKSSNVASVVHAMDKIQGFCVLIVGGVDKGASYKPWIPSCHPKVRQIVAYGRAREKIAQELQGHLPLVSVENFAEAVEMAVEFAQKGDTVLLSPGCSSYDQFRNFEHRGEVFKELIERKYGSKKNHSDRGDD